jgi:hypothetical protein
MLKRISILLFSIVFGGCSLSEDPQDGFYIVNYTVNFSQSTDNWEVDFADYPARKADDKADDSIRYDLKTDISGMPASTNLTGNGLLISGTNNNADLFMFLKRKVGGLTPNTDYTIVFDVTLASNAPSGLIGGNASYSPGQGVYLKVGAVDKNPVKVIQGDYYRMNIDKGNNEASGSNMITIGDIGVAAGTQNYAIIKRSNSTVDTPIVVRTNGNGELWLIVGTDSVFQGTTAVYYSRIDVVFSANNQ